MSSFLPESAAAPVTAGRAADSYVPVGVACYQQEGEGCGYTVHSAIGTDINHMLPNFDAAVYPKLSATWVVSDEPFFRVPWITGLKLRAAYGERYPVSSAGAGQLLTVIGDFAHGSADGGGLLMLAWANRAALAATEETGQAHFWSRSRDELWRKGATSGNTQAVVDVAVDCDGDVLLSTLQRYATALGRDLHRGRAVGVLHQDIRALVEQRFGSVGFLGRIEP